MTAAKTKQMQILLSDAGDWWAQRDKDQLLEEQLDDLAFEMGDVVLSATLTDLRRLKVGSKLTVTEVEVD